MKLLPFALGVLILLIAIPTDLSAQVTILDTIYTPTNYPDTSLAATLFIPDPSTAKGVGVVLARGSGLDRHFARVWCDTLAARGYLAMTIDYYDLNVVPHGLYPKPVRAFKTAVEFLRRNAERFGISTGKIVGFGQSQGSIVWGQTITWDNDDAFFGTDPSIDDHLDAAILLYGAYDMFTNLTSALREWLITHFSPDLSLRATKGQCISNVPNITTPLLLFHGTADQVVNIYHSRVMRDSLQFYGRNQQFVEYSGSAHGFDMVFSTRQFSSLGLASKDTVLAFLERVLDPPTLVAHGSQKVPKGFHLGQNYPNPFNPSTQIRYEMPEVRRVRLSIVDVLGREVATLVDEEMPAGTHAVTWDASEFPSGVYVCRFQAGGFVDVLRMLLVR